MKIACHILSYNINSFIDHVLENSAPHVDKIFITYSVKPWGYIPESRRTKTNPTTLARVHEAIRRLITMTGTDTQVEIIEGEWDNEPDTRNACLKAAREQGYDWLIVQDADEFYTERSWNNIKKSLYEDNRSDCIKTTWYLFWKSSHFVIEEKNGNIKSTNACFAIRCGSGKEFISNRNTNCDNISILDFPCFHYSFVMTDEEVAEKVSTWGHAHQFDRHSWYKHKWLGWNLETRNIAPGNPDEWKRAIRFPGEQPDFAKHFALPVSMNHASTLQERLDQAAWDLRFGFWKSVRDAKRFVAG